MSAANAFSALDPNAFRWGDAFRAGRARLRQQNYDTDLARLISGGDYQGAIGRAGEMGDLERVLSLQGAERENRTQQRGDQDQLNQIGYRAAVELARITDPAQRRAHADAIYQYVAKLGLPFQPFDDADLTDESLQRVQSALGNVMGMAPQAEYKFGTVGGQLYSGNPATGAVTFSDPGISEAAAADNALDERRFTNDQANQAARLGLEERRTAAAEARAGAAQATADSTLSTRAAERAQSLRKEWTSISSDFAEVARGYANIQQLATRRDSASDLALIVAFTKVLDPGSVAREGEVALTQQAAGLLQNASVWMQRLASGQTLLPDDVRQAYVQAAGDIYGQIEQSYGRRQNEFGGIVQREGLDPSMVLLDFTAPPAQTAATPPGGTSGAPSADQQGGLSADEEAERQTLRQLLGITTP